MREYIEAETPEEAWTDLVARMEDVASKSEITVFLVSERFDELMIIGLKQTEFFSGVWHIRKDVERLAKKEKIPIERAGIRLAHHWRDRGREESDHNLLVASVLAAAVGGGLIDDFRGGYREFGKIVVGWLEMKTPNGNFRLIATPSVTGSLYARTLKQGEYEQGDGFRKNLTLIH